MSAHFQDRSVAAANAVSVRASPAKHPLTITRQGVYAAGRSYRKECSFVSLAVGRFSPPGIPHAADQASLIQMSSRSDRLEDQLDLFGGQQLPAGGLYDDAEGALDAQTELLGLFTSKLVVEKHPVGRLLPASWMAARSPRCRDGSMPALRGFSYLDTDHNQFMPGHGHLDRVRVRLPSSRPRVTTS